MSKMDERILVAPRIKVFEFGKYLFQGVITDSTRVLHLIKNIGNNLEAMRRGDAEDNSAYKQPIPYCVIRQGEKIFGYCRLDGGGEKRLFGKISIGVGGHMNPFEGLFIDMLYENLHREIEEELLMISSNVDPKVALNIFGLINDELEEVGEVHIGILCIMELDESFTVDVRETDALEGKWYTKEELKSPEVYEFLEAWSKIAVDSLFPGGEPEDVVSQ